jgi:lipoprotein-anchoring transpeptidase ErfK/SrfK
MKRLEQRWGAVLIAALVIVGCDTRTSSDSVPDTVTQVIHDTVHIPSDTSDGWTAPQAPVTLPVLDAVFIDSAFIATLRSRLTLTDAEIDSLRHLSRAETARLREDYTGEYAGTTSAAAALARERITLAIGPQRTEQLFALVNDYWSGGDLRQSDTAAMPGDTSTASGANVPGVAARRPNSVPTDTRIVINAPAYRMDLYKDGELLRSYTIGIGYPEFPIPTGQRTARQIIFNPSWTPPDEPWVERSKVGKAVKPGSAKNPLGIAKVPIGLPSLIHAGKSASQLGGFASHGCAGLTDEQMREFSKLLAAMGGTTLTDSMIDAFRKKPTVEQVITLQNPVPVELRYETIVTGDGVLHIYRDVYGYNTNSQQELQRTLASYDLTPDQLSADERSKIDTALERMSLRPNGKRDTSLAASTGGEATRTDSTGRNSRNQKNPVVTKRVKGQKEMLVEIAALNGKGYPDPVEQKKYPATPSPALLRPLAPELLERRYMA